MVCCSLAGAAANAALAWHVAVPGEAAPLTHIPHAGRVGAGGPGVTPRVRDELGLNELDGMADGDARAEKARRKLQQSELRAGELGLQFSSISQSSYCDWCSELQSHSPSQQAPADRPAGMCTGSWGCAEAAAEHECAAVAWSLPEFCRWAAINP